MNEIQNSRIRVRAAIQWYREAKINVPYAHWYLQSCKEVVSDCWRIYRQAFKVAHHAGR